MSVLARQIDRVVREIQRDFVEWKVRVFELLLVNDPAIAVIARAASGMLTSRGGRWILQPTLANGSICRLLTEGANEVRRDICYLLIGRIACAVRGRDF
jgi:hypothetical protein